jgi:uncharacterized SAM-binding protein YcdF (DUF218 family)
MKTYDAVIVLANEMDANGVLNKESAVRANLAAKLADELQIPFVVTCGWAYRKDSVIKIADAFKSYLVNIGLESERIITEVNSRDTVGDAVFTRSNVVELMGFTKICIVTSNYHVARTRKIFDFVYGAKFYLSVEAAEVEFSGSILNKEIESQLSFEKTFEGIQSGDLEQIMYVLRKSHPFYNGMIYPEI